jgi:hypothetical protein
MKEEVVVMSIDRERVRRGMIEEETEGGIEGGMTVKKEQLLGRGMFQPIEVVVVTIDLDPTVAEGMMIGIGEITDVVVGIEVTEINVRGREIVVITNDLEGIDCITFIVRTFCKYTCCTYVL